MSRSVEVTTGSRLHFGPLACGGGEGRRFGGIGVMLAEPACRVRATRADADEIQAEAGDAGRVREILDRVRSQLGRREGIRIEVLAAIPPHRGLGSGTQLSLAVAEAVATLFDARPDSAAARARLGHRGERSAIGLYGFDEGGFLVDAGKTPEEAIGTLACRAVVPAEWRFVLACRRTTVGLSGESERAAFARLPPMAEVLSNRLARIVLAELLPALHTEDCRAFANGLSEYGRLVGTYFAPVQEFPFSDGRAWEYSEARRRGGRAGLVQTSWGPTVSLCCDSEAVAEGEAVEFRRQLGDDYEVSIAAPLNEGAEVRIAP